MNRGEVTESLQSVSRPAPSMGAFSRSAFSFLAFANCAVRRHSKTCVLFGRERETFLSQLDMLLGTNLMKVDGNTGSSRNIQSCKYSRECHENGENDHTDLHCARLSVQR